MKPAACWEMLVVSIAPVSRNRGAPITLTPPAAAPRRVGRLVAVTITLSRVGGGPPVSVAATTGGLAMKPRDGRTGGEC